MTQNSNNNSGWEVAGAKKISTKKNELNQSNSKPKQSNGKLNDLTVKMPKIETLPPLKADSTIYDLIRESDDEYDSDEINNNKKQKSQKVEQLKPKIESPKSKVNRKQQQQQQQESINLLATSIATTQKKKVQSVVKSAESELESSLNDLKLDEFEKELNNSNALFPNNLLFICQHLASYLNMKLNHIPDIEPLSTHENESTYPANKLERNVLKLFNTQISKLNRSDSENLFEFCFKSLFSDKTVSTHGYKIVIQLVSKQMPNLIQVNNLNKYVEMISLNKHKHQRCLISLWSLGQLGYYNLSIGVRVWFDVMLQFSSIKTCTNFVLTYLNSILNYHKLDTKSKSNDQLINLDQYMRLYDLVNDKSLVLNKDISVKLRQSFDLCRLVFLNDLSKNNHFELLLKSLPTENGPKQDDLLELLNECLLKNKETMLKWKQLFSKYLAQTIILLEHVSANHMKSFKSLKDTRDTLKYFDDHSSSVLHKITGNGKDSTGHHHKTHHFSRSKTVKSTQSETDLMKKFNKLVKQLLKQHFKQTSILSMVLRALFYTTIALGLFFYWDATQNKSIYTNNVRKQLQTYGLLEPTLKLIESVKRLFLTLKKLINYYIPIWQKKFNESVRPLAVKAWDTTKLYANLIWIKSGPYRDVIILYVNQGIDYTKENYPILIKNLESVLQLAINYVSTVTNFVLSYFFQLIHLVESQFGWKKGEMEKIVLDAFKILIESITQGLQQFNNFLNQQN